MAQSQYQLLSQRRFLPLFLVQSLGAMNDNILRFGLIFMLQAGLFGETALPTDTWINLSAAVLVLPFFVFSALAGQLADKLDKALLITRLKTAELILVGVAGFAITAGTLPWVLILLGLMGLQSTLFGPVKYSILPKVLDEQELTGGNGLIEGATYIAIILGTIIGGAAIVLGSPAWLAGILVCTALLGRIIAQFIPSTRPEDPTLKIRWEPVTATFDVLRRSREVPAVFLAIIGISWFWAAGLIATSQLPVIAAEWLRATNVPMILTLLPATFAIGVGIGALWCERLSRRRIELGLVPLGALALTIFSIDIGLALATPLPQAHTSFASLAREWTFWRVIFDLVATGIAAGLYSVPLYALLQQRSRARFRARVIAANNVVNALFMFLAAIAATLATLAGLSAPTLFILVGVSTIAVTGYLLFLLPEFVMRLVTWVLINVMYRLDIRGAQNLPTEGPVLLVCNHVSFIDALLIGGSIRRPVRFVMYYKIFSIPILSWIFKTAKAIPIAGYRENPEMLTRAYESIDNELNLGQVVGIFPEGAITRDGQIAPFKTGVENIIARRPVVVVPMALIGLWGSWFSRKGGAAGRKWPRRFRAPIQLTIGEPMPAQELTAEQLQSAVTKLYTGSITA